MKLFFSSINRLGMKPSVGLKLFVVSVTGLLFITCSSAATNSTDPACSLTCAVNTGVYPSSVNDATRTTFCSVNAMNYLSCSSKCQDSTDSFKAGINGYVNVECSKNQSFACSSLTSAYSGFSSCYSVGSLEGIVSGITRSYNDHNKSALDSNCQNLVWATNCQQEAVSSCSYMSEVPLNKIQSDFSTTAAFYTCGAESGTFTFNETGSCSSSLTTTLNSKCSVKCEISSATSIPQVCQILQSQADCIMSTSNGCSAIQSQYIVPRLTSYWAANQYLDCNITIKNITVGPRVALCDIGDVLKSCFDISSDGSLADVKRLLMAEFDVSHICKLLDTGITFELLINQCAAAMVECSIPLGQVYNSPPLNAPNSVYNDTQYHSELGPFALNAWGLQSLANSLALSHCAAYGNMVAQC